MTTTDFKNVETLEDAVNVLNKNYAEVRDALAEVARVSKVAYSAAVLDIVRRAVSQVKAHVFESTYYAGIELVKGKPLTVPGNGMHYAFPVCIDGTKYHVYAGCMSTLCSHAHTEWEEYTDEYTGEPRSRVERTTFSVDAYQAILGFEDPKVAEHVGRNFAMEILYLLYGSCDIKFE